MDAQKILTQVNDINKFIELFTANKKKNLTNYIKYYEGEQDILKRIHPVDPSKNDKLNKLVLNLSKKIVNFHADYMFSNNFELINNSENLQAEFDLFIETWETDKLNSFYLELAKELFAYSEVAEFVYNKNGSINHDIISVTNNKIFVNFNEKGDLDLFIRQYSTNEFIANQIVEVLRCELYFTNKCIFTQYNESKCIFEEIEGGYTYKKMPIVYYSIKEPIYWSQKSLLDRYNLINSIESDVIDCYSYPILILIGYLNNFDANGYNKNDGSTLLDYFKSGIPKIMHFDNSSGNTPEVKYLQQDGGNEWYESEVNKIKNSILYLSSVANISFENLKNLSNLSGVALKLMFLDADLYNKGLRSAFFHLSRSINLHKSVLSEIEGNNQINSLNIKVEFKSPIPDNINDVIDAIVTAKNSGILSTERAVEINPFVNNITTELERLENSESGTFNI